jgi:ER-bound oxygenase mpaB/B'/Rubber oxygenase, catalytic domain
MLDRMRLVGDPPADAAIEATFAAGQQEAAQTFMADRVTNAAPVESSLPPPLREFLEKSKVDALPNPDRIAVAQNLFVDHGPEILTTLGCYSLPSAYAARKGVQVLHRTAYLAKRPNRRLFRTMQMVVDVMEPGGLGAHGYGIRTIQKVRLIHAAIRYQLLHAKWDGSLGIPINQEDLAGTLLTFSYLPVQGLRKLGANITGEAAQAYFETWCAVGGLLGVMPEMIPDELEAGAELEDLICRRQFAPCDEGREMTRALIEMLERNSPPLLEGLPAGLMRLFMKGEVADYLGIPNTELDKDLAGIAVHFGRFVDLDLEESQWQAMIFRHHILSLIETMIKAEGGAERDFFRLPTQLHDQWRGASPESEEGVWGHLARWIVTRV